MVQLAMALVVLATLAGCATRQATINAFVDPSFSTGQVRSLAVFPVRNARLAPSESQEINRRVSMAIRQRSPRTEILSAVEAVRILNEKGLASEWTRFLDNYTSSGVPDAPALAGYRNGYRRGRLQTAEGPIEYGVPQVADRPAPFESRIRARLAGRTAELERLAVEMFARGLSTRDIEAAFRDAEGRSLLSRTAVSQVTERRIPAGSRMRSAGSAAPGARRDQRRFPRVTQALRYCHSCPDRLRVGVG
jgi:hypothetical protein